MSPEEPMSVAPDLRLRPPANGSGPSARRLPLLAPGACSSPASPAAAPPDAAGRGPERQATDISPAVRPDVRRPVCTT